MHCTVKLQTQHIRCGVAVWVGDKVYAFGGWNFRKPIEDQVSVYVFNTVSLRWRTLPPVTTTTGERPPEVPCSRRNHTAVLIEDIVYIWGGWNNTFHICNNMLYTFDVDAHRWIITRVSGTVPEGTSRHSACVLGKVMYVYGRWIKDDGNTNDTYKLDTTTMVWSLINIRGPLPPALPYDSATIIGTKMFVFGGMGYEGDCNNIRVFDTETNFWLNTPSARLLPKGRYDHSAFAYNGELYIFGGTWRENDSGTIRLWPCKDMWKFSPETLSWKKVKPKVHDSFWRTSGCCCMVGSRVVIFGRGKDDSPKDDLYILDLSPSLKTLCKLAVIQNDLEQSGLPHDIRWEMAAMT